MLKEPLVHFLLAGGVLFAAYTWLNPAPAPGGDSRIVLDQAQFDHLKNLWKAQWKRDPAPDDVKAIIDRYLRQEVFYREALRMGLDHNDDIIRKRMSQKMEAVASDLSTLMQPPTDEQLRAFFQEREDLFRLPQAYAFRQVLFLANEPQAEVKIKAVLASLRQGGTVPQDRRNKLALAEDWPLSSVQELDNAFGGGFAEALHDLPLGAWSGPVRSGYGWHLVRLERSQPPSLPDFEEVKDFVARQYEYYSVLDAQDRVYEELLAKYDVAITAGDVPAAALDGLSAR
ncbi:peptidyl-prolyl cis-trans isomerase [Mesorhizobium marinum]|uniref:peptidylprolyl isomerase n=1 Tax=Mesorhizobium marinum TaxID=3228790 RepID=UPI003465BA1F